MSHIEKLYGQPTDGGADERQELEFAILKEATRHWLENGGAIEHGYLPGTEGEEPKLLFTLSTNQNNETVLEFTKHSLIGRLRDMRGMTRRSLAKQTHCTKLRHLQE